MKIKEVIAATGLTDRAIRLYIEHGLLLPDTKESYSGRRNIEFSPKDVEKLTAISTLRRAGFSIAQIKALDEGGDAATAALHEFMDEKRTQHELDGRVLEVLDGFVTCGKEANLESVAERLASDANGDVPTEDLKASRRENLSRIFNILTALVCTLVIGGTISSTLKFYFDAFKHMKFNGNFLSLFAFVFMLAAFVSALTITVMYVRRAYTEEKRERRSKRAEKLAVVVIIQMLLINPSFVMTVWMPFVESETDDYVYYMVLDSYVVGKSAKEIHGMFPPYIPEYVYASDDPEIENSIKYYYRYADVVDSEIDIYAEWRLPEDKFQAEISRVTEAFPDGEKINKGKYSCIVVKGNGIRLFAYDDESNTVRYCFFFRLDENVNPIPYYEGLDWD